MMNWTFDDVVLFLKQHFFIEIHTRGSHYYFKGLVDGQPRLVEVQYHGATALKPRTFVHSIIPHSGIPHDVWKKWGAAGNRKARRRIQYAGARPW